MVVTVFNLCGFGFCRCDLLVCYDSCRYVWALFGAYIVPLGVSGLMPKRLGFASNVHLKGLMLQRRILMIRRSLGEYEKPR